MRGAALVLGFVTGLGLSAVAAYAASSQPPMGEFEGAYYVCDQSTAFQISYDSKSPKTATVTTSDNNQQFSLKRAHSASGAQFSNGAVTVTIEGDGATVEGTPVKLAGCKLKTTS